MHSSVCVTTSLHVMLCDLVCRTSSHSATCRRITTLPSFLSLSWFSSHLCSPLFLGKLVLVVFQVKSVINLLFAAYTGDVSALRRYKNSLLSLLLFLLIIFHVSHLVFVQVCVVLYGHGTEGLRLQDGTARCSCWRWNNNETIIHVLMSQCFC